jgi:hypothetical protein
VIFYRLFKKPNSKTNMRCPDCNKFVSLENGEPEEQNLEISHHDGDTFEITGEFRLPRTCSECGTELKEANFLFEFNTNLEGVTPEERENLSIEVEDMEVNESGGGRYAKNLFSLSGAFRITTADREISTVEGDSDQLSASSFDELV